MQRQGSRSVSLCLGQGCVGHRPYGIQVSAPVSIIKAGRLGNLRGLSPRFSSSDVVFVGAVGVVFVPLLGIGVALRFRHAVSDLPGPNERQVAPFPTSTSDWSSDNSTQEPRFPPTCGHAVTAPTPCDH